MSYRKKTKRLPSAVGQIASFPGGGVSVLVLFDALLKRLYETGGDVEGYDEDVIEPLYQWWVKCGRAAKAGVFLNLDVPRGYVKDGRKRGSKP